MSLNEVPYEEVTSEDSNVTQKESERIHLCPRPARDWCLAPGWFYSHRLSTRAVLVAWMRSCVMNLGGYYE